MVTLINLSKKVHVLILVHSLVCTEETCACGRQLVGVVDHDAETGGKKVRALKRKLADSATLMPRGVDGDTLHGLPHGVLRLDEVKLAMRRGEIKSVGGKEAEELHLKHLALQQKKRDAAVAERVKAGDAVQAAQNLGAAPLAVTE